MASAARDAPHGGAIEMLADNETSMERAASSSSDILKDSDVPDKNDGNRKRSMFLCIVEYFSVSLVVPEVYIFDQVEDDVREYHLTRIQRFFMTFEDPNYSLIGRVANIITIFTIMLSCMSFIIASEPTEHTQYEPDECEPLTSACYGKSDCLDYFSKDECSSFEDLCDGKNICPPKPVSAFDTIEFTCIVIFSVEYIARISTCWSVPARLAGLVSSGWDDAWVEITLEEETDSDVSEEQRRIKKSQLRAKVKKEPLYSWYNQLFKYTMQPFNLVDLGAILPWYLENSLQGGGLGSSGGVLRILRILRVFRVLKLGRRNRSVELLTKTLHASYNVLALLLFFVLLAVVFFGVVIFSLEGGTWTVNDEFQNGAYLRRDKLGNTLAEESPFTSMMTAFYYTMITLATTGYGELVPNTVPGRFCSAVVMIFGLVMVALPISVVGSNFTTEYNAVHGEDTDNEQIFSCLLELIDDDLYGPDGKRIPESIAKARRMSAIATIIACLDPIKHRKLKVELLKFLEDSRGGELLGKVSKMKRTMLGDGSGSASTSPKRPSKGQSNLKQQQHSMLDDDEDLRRLKDLSFALRRLEVILEGSDMKTREGKATTADAADTKFPSFALDTKSGDGKPKQEGTYARSIQPHSLSGGVKEVTVLNEDREWLEMVAKEGGVQHTIQREPLAVVQDLVVRMQALYMSSDASGKSGASTWVNTAIDRPEVQALALETAELHLVDMNRMSQEDQHAFFLCTYTLLCIHASAACKTKIETVVQMYPTRIGYQIGKQVYTLAEIYDRGGGNVAAPKPPL